MCPSSCWHKSQRPGPARQACQAHSAAMQLAPLPAACMLHCRAAHASKAGSTRGTPHWEASSTPETCMLPECLHCSHDRTAASRAARSASSSVGSAAAACACSTNAAGARQRLLARRIAGGCRGGSSTRAKQVRHGEHSKRDVSAAPAQPSAPPMLHSPPQRPAHAHPTLHQHPTPHPRPASPRAAAAAAAAPPPSGPASPPQSPSGWRPPPARSPPPAPQTPAPSPSRPPSSPPPAPPWSSLQRWRGGGGRAMHQGCGMEGWREGVRQRGVDGGGLHHRRRNRDPAPQATQVSERSAVLWGPPPRLSQPWEQQGGG